MIVSSVDSRYRRASTGARDLVDAILSEDADDQAWVEQIGPAFTGVTVARLLGVTPQAVSSNKGLLRLTMRSGRIGYPRFQFDGTHQVEGLADAVRRLRPVVASEWTIASWFTSPNAELGGDTPIDALRSGRRSEAVRSAVDRFVVALAA